MLFRAIGSTKEDELYFKKWFYLKQLIGGLIGYFGLSISLFFFFKITDLFIVNAKFSLPILFSFPIVAFMIFFFSHFYFSHEVIPLPGIPTTKKVGINIEVTFNFEQAKRLCLNVFFPLVQKELKILSGGLHPDFYGDPRIQDALTYMKETGINIKIVALNPDKLKMDGVATEDSTYLAEKVFIPLEQRGLLSSVRCVDEMPKLHWMIADKRHIRIEQRHLPWWRREGRGLTDEVRAVLYLDSPKLANSYEPEYDIAFQEGVPVNVRT